MKQRTSYILLGLLKREGPLSGYDMKKLISESTAYFWNESFGAIYPTLHKLESEGFVSHEEQGEKRKLIRYSITKKGELALMEWLALPAEFQKPRNELLLKLFFSEGSPPEQTREHIEMHLLHIQQRLKLLEQIAVDLELNYSKDPSLPYWMMTINHGIIQMRATIEWCQHCLDTLEKL